jgi:hypothetical protein
MSREVVVAHWGDLNGTHLATVLAELRKFAYMDMAEPPAPLGEELPSDG